jgi:NifU-like protein
MIPLFSWATYPKKLKERILKPSSIGRFNEDRGMRLATGRAGDTGEGNAIELFWLVDPDDGKIVDAKFLAFGPSSLIGAGETLSRWVIGKNYDQARRVTSDLIESEVEGPFPKESLPFLNLALEAVDEAAKSCLNIPLPTSYNAPPVTFHGEIVPGGIENWFELPLNEQLGTIEQVLDKDIRPYIALDAGGVEVLNLLEGREVIIAYQGSCTSCYSSTGATLSYIQQVLRAKIHPSLTVTPNL